MHLMLSTLLLSKGVPLGIVGVRPHMVSDIQFQSLCLGCNLRSELHLNFNCGICRICDSNLVVPCQSLFHLFVSCILKVNC